MISFSLKTKKIIITFNIFGGDLCLSLSEIVTSRMLTTTDVPLLAVQLLMDQQPWIRRIKRSSDDESGSRNNVEEDDDDGEMFEIYDNGEWRRCSHDEASGSSIGGQIHPVAAHLWLLLLSLLMSPVAPRKYELNDFRCQQLLKVKKKKKIDWTFS